MHCARERTGASRCHRTTSRQPREDQSRGPSEATELGTRAGHGIRTLRPTKHVFKRLYDCSTSSSRYPATYSTTRVAGCHWSLHSTNPGTPAAGCWPNTHSPLPVPPPCSIYRDIHAHSCSRRMDAVGMPLESRGEEQRHQGGYNGPEARPSRTEAARAHTSERKPTHATHSHSNRNNHPPYPSPSTPTFLIPVIQYTKRLRDATLQDINLNRPRTTAPKAHLSSVHPASKVGGISEGRAGTRRAEVAGATTPFLHQDHATPRLPEAQSRGWLARPEQRGARG